MAEESHEQIEEATSTTTGTTTTTTSAHMHTLLQHKNTPRFVLRCVENELPPNLVHSLRLLRVLELQSATQPDAPPLSQQATKNVADLLCDPAPQDASSPHSQSGRPLPFEFQI